MANESMALAERTVGVQRIQDMAGPEITTPAEFAERIRQLQGQAHILSPMAAVARIAPSHVINAMVVVIDPSVDAKSGRGADVYHQPSIHKTKKVGNEYVPIEVSLNKFALLKMLKAAGVNVYPPSREFRERYWWIVSHEGDILDFDGRYLRVPPGTASVDLRDGSADIGEWTPEAWQEATKVAAEQKKRTPPEDQWKIKPSVNGWTHERVMQQRKFGLELAETKSLNRLARNLGIRQAYTIEELAKPFVLFRASYVPDTTNPRVAEMLAAANLGARMTLYPGSASTQPMGEVSHAVGDPSSLIEGAAPGEIVHDEPEQMQTAPPPSDAEEVTFDEPEPKAAQDLFHVVKVTKRGEEAGRQYFVETKEGLTLYTADVALAKACAAAAKDGLPREIPTERVMVQGAAYRQIIEVLAGGKKL